MAHCPPELLDDLAEVFALLGTWAGVVQKTPGVFYLRREPFLHFHLLKGERRRADVRRRAAWVEIDLPRPISRESRRALLRELRARYAERLPRGPARPPRPEANRRRPAPSRD